MSEDDACSDSCNQLKCSSSGTIVYEKVVTTKIKRYGEDNPDPEEVYQDLLMFTLDQENEVPLQSGEITPRIRPNQSRNSSGKENDKVRVNLFCTDSNSVESSDDDSQSENETQQSCTPVKCDQWQEPTKIPVQSCCGSSKTNQRKCSPVTCPVVTQSSISELDVAMKVERTQKDPLRERIEKMTPQDLENLTKALEEQIRAMEPKQAQPQPVQLTPLQKEITDSITRKMNDLASRMERPANASNRPAITPQTLKALAPKTLNANTYYSPRPNLNTTDYLSTSKLFRSETPYRSKSLPNTTQRQYIAMHLNSKGEKKRSNKNSFSQKVIIPKGMINPDETTVIEIPPRLHRQPIVIAKHKNTDLGRGLLCSSFRNHNEHGIECPTYFRMPAYSPIVPQVNATQHCFKPNEECYQTTQCNVSSLKSLNVTEEKERSELQHNLEAFQRARRKLLENTTKLTASSDTATKIVKNAYYYDGGKQLNIY